MNNTPDISPELRAIDMLRVNINAMTLEDLEAHAQQVLDTQASLNEYANSTALKSANARRNAVHHIRKLRQHMERVRDLINAHQLAAAVVVATMQAAGLVSLAPCAKPPGC